MGADWRRAHPLDLCLTRFVGAGGKQRKVRNT